MQKRVLRACFLSLPGPPLDQEKLNRKYLLLIGYGDSATPYEVVVELGSEQ